MFIKITQESLKNTEYFSQIKKKKKSYQICKISNLLKNICY